MIKHQSKQTFHNAEKIKSALQRSFADGLKNEVPRKVFITKMPPGYMQTGKILMKPIDFLPINKQYRTFSTPNSQLSS